MRILKFITACCFIIVCALGILILLLGLGSRCDKEAMSDNARESLNILAEEGDYFKPYIPVALFMRDNCSDALILSNSAAEMPDMTEFENILYSPIFSADGPSTAAACYNAFSDSIPPYDHAWSYARYWHGYKVMVRPLLSIMDIRGIRVFNLCFGCALFFFAFLLINKKVGLSYSLTFAVAILSTGFPLLLTTIQFTTCYLLAFLGIISVCLLKERFLYSWIPYYIFLLIGALTSFSDLLTIPLLTLGLPLIVVLLRRERLPDWRFLIFCGIMWGTGYASVWIAKWILVYLFLPDEIIENVKDAILLRSSGISLHNVKYFWLMVILCVLVAMLLGLSARLRVLTGKQRFKRCLPLLIIGLLPFIWILILRNHSFVHYWFVWRVFAVTIMGVGSFYIKLSGRKFLYNLITGL